MIKNHNYLHVLSKISVYLCTVILMMSRIKEWRMLIYTMSMDYLLCWRGTSSLKDNSWWGKAPLEVPVSDATMLQQNAHTEASRVRWRKADRWGTPTDCSGVITSSISNCLLPLTTNTAIILSEQHVSNKFLQSSRLHLPGKKINYPNVCCYFSWFSYILTSMNMAWLFRVKFHCDI